MNIVRKYNKTIIIIGFVLLLTIAFQTFQQIFYMKRFQLAENIDFFDVLKTQSYRWIIWLIIGIVFPFLVKADIYKEKNGWLFFKHLGIVFLLVLLNILIISLLQIINSVEVVTINTFFIEYFSFFLFQKAPMYTLGYLAIVILLFFNFENQKLNIEVQELVDLKKTNEIEYQKLKSKNTDQAKVLSIKIGNKRKVISIAEIVWIEADDYCVIVHTAHKPSYTMRSSLKTLEGKLDHHFLRVHRKGIVNMKMIKEFDTSSQPILVLNNNDKVPVAKANLKLVNSFLKN